MAWEERIKEAAYTPPSGTRFLFTYENVSKEISKKTTGFNFPDAPGTFVQDLGKTGRRYPLRIIFWGENYDLEANSFEAALEETGVGKLEHPIYGTVDVVPFGDIKRRDDLKTAAGQTIIETTFWETSDLLFPVGQTEPVEIVIASIEKYIEAAAIQFDEQISIEDATERASLKSKFTALLDTAKSKFQKIADAQRSAQKQFNDTYNSINSIIDTLISTPLNLAFQLQVFLGAPARALASIRARLDAASGLLANILGQGNDALGQSNDGQKAQTIAGFTQALLLSKNLIGGVPAQTLSASQSLLSETPALALAGIEESLNTYKTFVDNLIIGDDAIQTPNLTTLPFNDFKVTELFATGSVISQVLAAVETQFSTAPQAFEAAEAILDLSSDVTVWMDDNYKALSEIDTGEAYQQFQNTVALTAGFLVQISFSLKQKRTIVLDRARTIIDLSAELYGEIDTRLDFLINSNNLSGSEILELPKGRSIEYYI